MPRHPDPLRPPSAPFRSQAQDPAGTDWQGRYEEQFRLLVEHSSDLISLQDPEGRMWYHSPSITRLLGYGQWELIGHQVLDYVHADDLPAAREALDMVRSASGTHPPFEVRFRHADGTWRWFECTGTNLLDTPSFGRIVFNAHDITGHRQTSEALRRSEKNFRTIIENVSDIITVLRPDGAIVFHSDSIGSTLGYQPDELIGQNVFELTHPDDVPAIAGAFAAPTGLPARHEFRFRHKDGSWRVLEGVGRAIFEGNAVSSIIVVSRDITERRELEERLRQAQKLESVGLLAGGIAHDFNNMLTVITGYSEMVLDQVEPGSPLRDDIREIGKAADKAAMLTYQLLAFSRKQILQPRTLSLNDVVTDLSRMLGRLIGEHIRVRLTLEPGLAMAHADPNQLAQVVMNLAVNARDAMPDGGTLTIETATVALDEAFAAAHAGAPTGPHVMLAVSDNGLGMDAATRARVFEPFFTTKGVGKGTGMGLATVYGIVRQSGGTISVSSEPGQGSTFRIYLPVSEDDRSQASAREESGMPRGTERILLAEDDAQVRKLARQVLEAHGYTVVEAHNGRHAVELSGRSAESFDLLLTDVVMPHLGGRALADHLHQSRPDLRVLYMSGYTDNAIVHHGVLDPAMAFLQKPFTARGLLQAVRTALDCPAG